MFIKTPETEALPVTLVKTPETEALSVTLVKTVHNKDDTDYSPVFITLCISEGPLLDKTSCLLSIID